MSLFKQKYLISFLPVLLGLCVNQASAHSYNMGVYLGNTYMKNKNVPGNSSNHSRDNRFTSGLFAEKRFHDGFAVGVTGEYLLDANHNHGSYKAVAQGFYYLKKNLKIGVGPGIEKIKGANSHALIRVGGAYDFRFAKKYSISPTIYTDIVDGHTDYGMGVSLKMLFGGKSKSYKGNMGYTKRQRAIRHAREQEDAAHVEQKNKGYFK